MQATVGIEEVTDKVEEVIVGAVEVLSAEETGVGSGCAFPLLASQESSEEVSLISSSSTPAVVPLSGQSI